MSCKFFSRRDEKTRRNSVSLILTNFYYYFNVVFISRAIKKAIEKLSHRQELHIKHYDPSKGLDNTRRLTGKHETASYKTFSSATASRNVSIRIPRQVDEEQCGYFEDRRPAANCDPYAVTNILVKTVCLDPIDDGNTSNN